MLAITHKIKHILLRSTLLLSCLLTVSMLTPVNVFAVQASVGGGGGCSGSACDVTGGSDPLNDPIVVKKPANTHYRCGGANRDDKTYTSIDIGCSGNGAPILDMTFAIVRFLSDGVGLVIIGSLVWAGIQYSGSRGDPQATAAAVKRIRSTILALVLFMFAFAIIGYLLPDLVLQG